jgi:hypothetical protein
MTRKKAKDTKGEFRAFRALSWFSRSRTPTDKELYQRQIEATDRQINALVYEFYGLGEEEIEIVEGRLDHE